MNICDECGLPIKACNANAVYQMAARNLERGDTESAKKLMKEAQSWHDEFMKEHRALGQSTRNET